MSSHGESEHPPIEDHHHEVLCLAEAAADEYHHAEIPTAAAHHAEIPAAAAHHAEVPAAAAAAAAAAEGLKHLVASAGRIKDPSSREMALLNALRTCRVELDAAKLHSDVAAKRFQDLKNVYNYATRVLSGYTPLEERAPKKKSPPELLQQAKRLKIKRECTDDTSISGTPIKEPEEVPLPTNPIHLPQKTYSSHPPDLISQHKEAFYQKLLNCSVSELPSFTPPSNSANLKSKAQLAEWIYIAQNWSTGAEGLNAGAFRAKYKTWYSRMKPVTVNLGRRTGIHLRDIEAEDGPRTVLCRHSKDGSKSTVYLDVESLFDALYEIHAVELSHRGRDAVKNLADERYANVPDAQVRYFIDTCPVCVGKKMGGGLVERVSC